MKNLKKLPNEELMFILDQIFLHGYVDLLFAILQVILGQQEFQKKILKLF